MFGIFRNNPAKKLEKKYDRLMEEAYRLSRSNRKLADQKYAEAEEIMQKLVLLKKVN